MSKSRKVKTKTTKNRHFNSKKNHLYFTYEEIGEIRDILKTKNLINVPFIVAATILRKISIIQQLIKDGYDVNETGQNNATALIWAVKYKFLDIIDFLIENGANPAVETHNGDNIFTIALGSKLWDEDSFIKLWHSIRKLGIININFTNKSGHSLVHLCVKRDWEQCLKILLSEQPNVNMANSNGVTPLMYACFRQNLNIVKCLFNAGADPIEEDHHGRISLCYAISTRQSPSEITDCVIEEITKISTIDYYLRRRVELILLTAEKGEISCSASGMLLRSIQFSIQYLENSLETLLNEQIFTKLQTTIKSTNSMKCLEFLIKIINEILFYNNDSIGYHWNLHKKLLQQFATTYITAVCFDYLKSQNSSILSNLCFKTLVLSTSQHQSTISEENAKILQNYSDNTTLFDDESLNRKEIVIVLEKRKETGAQRDITIFHLQQRLTIMKETCRNCLYVRKSLPDPIKIDDRKQFELKQIKEYPKIYRNKYEWQNKNPIVASFQYLLESDNDNDNKIHADWPEWKKMIYQIDFNNCKQFQNLKIDENLLNKALNCLKYSKTSNDQVMKAFDIIEDYFTKIIEFIIGKYWEFWKIEQGEYNSGPEKEHTAWQYHKHITNIDNYKTQLIGELQASFKQLFENIRNLGHRNPQYCYQQINQLENLLLNHKIRGIEIMCYITRYKHLLLKYTTINPELSTNYILEYIEGVLNNQKELIKDIAIEIVFGDNAIIDYNPDDLYCKEMAQLMSRFKSTKDVCREMETKQNTIDNSYHLIDSIIAICNDDDDDDSINKNR